MHFLYLFAKLPDLPVKEFHGYSTDFRHPKEAEAATYESMVIECEDYDALKQVSFNKSSRMDILTYKVVIIKYIKSLLIHPVNSSHT